MKDGLFLINFNVYILFNIAGFKTTKIFVSLIIIFNKAILVSVTRIERFINTLMITGLILGMGFVFVNTNIEYFVNGNLPFAVVFISIAVFSIPLVSLYESFCYSLQK